MKVVKGEGFQIKRRLSQLLYNWFLKKTIPYRTEVALGKEEKIEAFTTDGGGATCHLAFGCFFFCSLFSIPVSFGLTVLFV